METKTTSVPRPITPGAEMTALARFYPDVTWTGTIVAGGMGPGSPAMTGKGRGVHQSIQDGRWIVGTYEQDQFDADGHLVLTWQMHWVVGWDPVRQTYRATLADNYGHADVMTGHLDGDRLTFESTSDGLRLRLTWDASDPQTIIWINECSIGEGPWTLIESYRLQPVGPRTS
jgi:hypothetical protein